MGVRQAQERGHNPVEHIVGYDALAIYVNKKNPANSMTLADLAKIYGRNGGTTQWKDLGIHNMAQARRASEECIFMLIGKVVEHTLTEQMFVTPQHQETADYIEGRFG